MKPENQGATAKPDIETHFANFVAAREQLIESLATVSQVSDQEKVERVYGTEAIRNRLVRLGRDTVSEIDTLTPGVQRAEDIAAIRVPNEALLTRGVDIRTVYLSSSLTEPETIENLTWLKQRGAKTRTASEIPIRMIISDRKIAVLPIDTINAMEGGILITSEPGPVRAFCALFDHVWYRAIPFELNTVGSAPEELNDTERKVIALLAADHTYPAIARKLGISERSVRYITKSLYERLGATSRFAAGALAAKAGWL